MLKRIFLLPILAMPLAVHAAGIDALKSFISNTDTAQARFAQMVLDRNMKQLQQASGTMQFSRPGKFRWVYNKPYEQVIVGDGTQLWIYDKDLNQVTVRRLDRALGEYVIEGIRSNLSFHRWIVRHPRFIAGDFDTGFIQDEWRPGAVAATACRPASLASSPFLRRANRVE